MALPRFTVAELRSADRRQGEDFEALLLLRRCATRTARNETTYLAVELGDRTGAFSANVFADNPLSELFRSSAEGAVVLVEARVDFYQGRLSPKLLHARAVSDDELATRGGCEALVESTPEDARSLRTEFDRFVASIAHEPLRRTVESSIGAVGEAFFTAPAAMAMHHAYRSGLLEHTVHVARICASLLPHYPEVSPDLALAGALLHDIGKATEYQGALAPKKSRTGQLQGHVVLGYRVVRKAGIVARLDADLLERLEHIILSHQGELEWGAAVMAATPEAVFVSMADNLDARMGMVQRALRTGDTEEFSEYMPGLKSPVLRVHPVFHEPAPRPPKTPPEVASDEPPPADG